jgi:hypothetical protein
LFEPLEPPVGGIDALRGRLARERVRLRRRRQLGAFAATLAITGILLSLVGLPALTARRAGTASLDFGLAHQRMGRTRPPSDPVTIPAGSEGEIAAMRVPSSDERVVFYLVATRNSTAASSPAAEDPSESAEPETDGRDGA